MQFSVSFLALSSAIAAALTGMVTASPVADANGVVAKRSPEASDPANFLAKKDLQHWLANTDADITFIGSGKPLNVLTRDVDAAEDTYVVYCSKRSGEICGGSCTYYTGGATCLSASNTNCLYASHDVAFCDGSGCNGSCHEFSDCGHILVDGFCSTPGTNSILVGPY